jgi:hypothetical protein
MSGRDWGQEARRRVGRSGVVGAKDLCDRGPIRLGEHVLGGPRFGGRLLGDRLAWIGNREELIGGRGRLRPHLRIEGGGLVRKPLAIDLRPRRASCGRPIVPVGEPRLEEPDRALPKHRSRRLVERRHQRARDRVVEGAQRVGPLVEEDARLLVDPTLPRERGPLLARELVERGVDLVHLGGIRDAAHDEMAREERGDAELLVRRAEHVERGDERDYPVDFRRFIPRAQIGQRTLEAAKTAVAIPDADRFHLQPHRKLRLEDAIRAIQLIFDMRFPARRLRLVVAVCVDPHAQELDLTFRARLCLWCRGRKQRLRVVPLHLRGRPVPARGEGREEERRKMLHGRCIAANADEGPAPRPFG